MHERIAVKEIDARYILTTALRYGIVEINRLIANRQRVPKRLSHLENQAAVERARERAGLRT